LYLFLLPLSMFLCLFFGSYMDLILKFCTYFCFHYQCFYVCFLGHIWTSYLSFVPIFVYINNVFMFVFLVIYGITPKFCTYVLFTFSMNLCLFFWVIYGLKFCTYFWYIINNFYVCFWVTY
jgi:hypothetical protein